jgi:FKBP-type peptidyl-prolyl cis-trans isomerase FklB
MTVGSKYMFYIPADLAYGANPRPGGAVKPNDVLIFEVELLDIIKE